MQRGRVPSAGVNADPFLTSCEPYGMIPPPLTPDSIPSPLPPPLLVAPKISPPHSLGVGRLSKVKLHVTYTGVGSEVVFAPCLFRGTGGVLLYLRRPLFYLNR